MIRKIEYEGHDIRYYDCGCKAALEIIIETHEIFKGGIKGFPCLGKSRYILYILKCLGCGKELDIKSGQIKHMN